MPELPEVEIVMRRLRDGAGSAPSLLGCKIVALHAPSKLVLRQISAPVARTLLQGARIMTVERRAKHIVVATNRDGTSGAVVLHLRMTGDLNVVPTHQPLPRFTRAAFALDCGWTLAFTDGRHLGTVHVVEDPTSLLAALGPEPLAPAFDVDAFAARLKGARPIKAALLDQTVIAGVGNIYADESLFRARIAPTRATSSLTSQEIAALHGAIRAALTESIDALVGEGKHIAWRYLHRESASPFLVYERGGEPCTRCGTVLLVLRVAGRTTVACPKCQSLTAQPLQQRGRAHVAAPRPSSRGESDGPATTKTTKRSKTKPRKKKTTGARG